MRHILVVALALGVCACASEGQRQAAMLQCQAVGVSQSDPYFDTCTRAYTLQANQDNLDISYHRALNPTYENPRISHAWHGY
jgi:hypothetical protein